MAKQRPTRRQIEVLRTYIRAGSVAAAAHDLGISETTVRQHLSGLYRRTGCLNAAQAAYWLGRGGLDEEWSSRPARASQPELSGPPHGVGGRRGGGALDHPAPSSRQLQSRARPSRRHQALGPNPSVGSTPKREMAPFGLVSRRPWAYHGQPTKHRGQLPSCSRESQGALREFLSRRIHKRSSRSCRSAMSTAMSAWCAV